MRRLQRSVLYVLFIWFIQASVFCNLGWAKQQPTTLLSSYKYSDIYNNLDNEYGEIDFKGQLYFLEINPTENNLDLITTNITSNYKLIKNTTSLTNLTGITNDNVRYYYLDVQASSNQIFVAFNGTTNDSHWFSFLLSSTDGKTWKINETFPIKGSFEDRMNDLLLSDAANNKIGITYSAFDQETLKGNDTVYFSTDDGLTWNNFELPSNTYVVTGPYIANDLFFVNVKSFDSNSKSSLYYTDGKSELVEANISNLQEYLFKNDQSTKQLQYIESIYTVNNKLIANAAYAADDDDDSDDGKMNLLWISNNNGKTWAPLRELGDHGVTQMKFDNNKYYLMTTDGENTYYYSLNLNEFDAAFVKKGPLAPTYKFEQAFSMLLDYKSTRKTFLVSDEAGVKLIRL